MARIWEERRCPGFRFRQVEKRIERELSLYRFNYISLRHASYDTPDLNFSDILKPDFLNKCTEAYKAMIAGDKDRAQGFMDAPFVEDLVSMAAFFKHQAFFEEREVRIVALPWDEHLLNAITPKRRGQLITKNPRQSGSPTIELFNDAKPLPITRIIVGPQSAQDERVTELKQLTKGCGITIDRSETPYRPNGDA